VTPSKKEERTFLERLRDALQGKSSKQVEPVEEDDAPYYFV
jgi:hypothetical protein